MFGQDRAMHFQRLFNLYLFLLTPLILFNGIISNFLPSLSGIGLGTIILDSDLIVGMIILITAIIYTKKIILSDFMILFIFFAFSFMLLIKTGLDDNALTERLLGWRNYIIYGLPSILFLYINFDKHKYIRFLTILMTVLCIFAISQYFLHNIYPSDLLKLKIEENSFSFFGTNITRVNGLVGNTIIFTGFSFLASLLNLNIFLTSRKPIYLVAFVVCYLSLWLTFSRAAWVIGTAMLMFNYMIIARFKISRLIIFTTIIIILGVTVYAWLNSNTNSFIYRRLFSQEVSTQGSDVVHFGQINSAIAKLQEQPTLGVGLGTQGGSADTKHIIISDGWLLQLALEFGVPLAIVFVICLICVLLYGFWIMKFKQSSLDVLAVTFISATIYFLITGILNSALVGKTVYAVYFIILGLLLSSKPKRSQEYFAHDNFR
jgi:hypothetical protein